VARYSGGKFEVGYGRTLLPDDETAARAWLKYGAAVAHTAFMYQHLLSRAGAGNFELEVSVDETDSVTTYFEHFLVARELRRLGVEFVSIAPRFIGDFEKGVDYRGDLQTFRVEYEKQLAVATHLGHKISFHSGSDKFRAYAVVGWWLEARSHIKTAGTSYLEALRTVATHEPKLFREILDFSREVYDTERATYHVSAELSRVPSGADCEEEELLSLLEQDDARQVLHVAFGRVLTAADGPGTFRFKSRIMDCLAGNEETHYGYLERHFRKHLEFFSKVRK